MQPHAVQYSLSKEVSVSYHRRHDMHGSITVDCQNAFPSCARMLLSQLPFGVLTTKLRRLVFHIDQVLAVRPKNS